MIVLCFNLMVNGTDVVLNARIILEEEATDCDPTAINSLSEGLAVIDQIITDMNETVNSLEETVDSLEVAVASALDELEQLVLTLEEEFGVSSEDSTSLVVLPEDNDLPLILPPEQHLSFNYEEELEEL